MKQFAQIVDLRSVIFSPPISIKIMKTCVERRQWQSQKFSKNQRVMYGTEDGGTFHPHLQVHVLLPAVRHV
jgi:hypothetical protein